MALDTTIGGASTDSYITLAEWWAYWLARGVDLTQHGHDSAHEANLREAADYLKRGITWAGYRQYETQAQAWPRLDVGYVDGWYIDADTIPQDIKNAQAELAYLIHEGLDLKATISGAVKATASKVGPIEKSVEYAGSLGTPRLVAIEGLVAPYLAAGSSQAMLVRG